MEAVCRRVRHGGGTEYPRLTPASGGDPHIGARLDPVPHRDRQWVHAEALGADKGQVQGGQRGHRVGRHEAGAVTGGMQYEPGQTVDSLVAGDDGAVVVGHEAGAAGAAGEVVDADQRVVTGGRLVRITGMSGPRALPLPVSAPGPRAPSRHGRTSPPYTCALTSTLGAR